MTVNFFIAYNSVRCLLIKPEFKPKRIGLK